MDSMNVFTKDVVQRVEGNFDKTLPVFGIDLGTTNSAISVITQGDKPEAITLTSGKKTMPSCVMWKNGEFIVGDYAYQNRECANVVYSVKRHMQRVGKKVKFRDGSKVLELTPAEVSAEILKGLVEQTGGVYGEIKDVIVTVPAYFDQNGRNATRKACELAGLNLLDILNEPTAASLCYDVDNGSGMTEFVTFDFGGGTFDATLARILSNVSDSIVTDFYGIESNDSSGKTIECLAIEGDSRLGGDDIDRELYSIVCEKLDRMGVDTSKFTLEYREHLILRLEALKKQGTESIYSVKVETVLTNGEKVKQEITVSQNDFHAALMPSYHKCKSILDKLLTGTPNSADKIVLVGGSTKNPLLVNQLKLDYPDFQISSALNQDLAVTLGAAIKGKITKFGSDSVKVFDILPMTIGVRAKGKVTPIIMAGTVLPAKDSMMFTTLEDNQQRMRLEVLQGNSASPEACVSLGTLLFDNIPPGKVSEVNLCVTITVDATSKMTCIGEINGESKELKLDLTGSTSAKTVSKADVLLERWKRAAENIGGKAGKQLSGMIANYPDIVSKRDIMQFIKEHTTGVSDEHR